MHHAGYAHTARTGYEHIYKVWRKGQTSGMRQARRKEKEITQGRHNLQRVAGKQHKEKLKG